jgi:5S rRNA maturation endonuclease (ribonuclease M5)
MQKIKSQLNKSMGAKIEREMMAKLKKEGKPLHVLKDTSTAAEQKAPTFSGKFVNKKTLSKKK